MDSYLARRKQYPCDFNVRHLVYCKKTRKGPWYLVSEIPREKAGWEGHVRDTVMDGWQVCTSVFTMERCTVRGRDFKDYFHKHRRRK